MATKSEKLALWSISNYPELIVTCSIKDGFFMSRDAKQYYTELKDKLLEQPEVFGDQEARKETYYSFFQSEDLETISKQRAMARISHFIKSQKVRLTERLINEFMDTAEDARDPVSLSNTIIEINTDVNVDLVKSSTDFIDDMLVDMAGNKTGGHIAYPLATMNENIVQPQKGDVLIVGARPKHGKTTFSIAFMIENSIRQNKKCLFISLEMAKEQLIKRSFSPLLDIPYRKLMENTLSNSEMKLLKENIPLYKKDTLFFANLGGTSPEQIIFLIEHAVKTYGIDYVVIDYIQLLSTDKKEIDIIMKAMKNLALTLGIVIIANSQLSRDVERRENKRPISSDLRESGQIEATADFIFMLYYQFQYTKEEEDKGEIEVILSQARNVPPQTVFSGFDGSLQKFYDK